ncbi:putative actin-related protein ro7 [Golovinomyces cichoracearum]|uniref:Putative actin-related protein ro7 n=1 Tax=Golovinomyces cichoracearum TaxID=62708 RepID=A0A420H9H1_9PEZI|nr:putative actin-related protein ro7 [Golovinomyces cichoracearum]
MSTINYHATSTTRAPRNSPAGPQTPSRSQVTPSFGSLSVLRAEEECVIIELGGRFLRVGLAGIAAPQAVVDFGPEQQRRVGDLRRWAVNYDSSIRSKLNGKSWGEDYELWPLDLRNIDLSLIGDKIERAVRDAFTKNLLVDSRPRRILLAIPTILPFPLLLTVLETLFSNFQPPNISLMSKPILTTVAAGLRSALVVDIGWAETTVSSVYEFREITSSRSVRASKLLGQTVFNRISSFLCKNYDFESSPEKPETQLSFEECEEIVERMIWCKSRKKRETEELDTKDEGESSETNAHKNSRIEDHEPNGMVSLPLNSIKPPRTIQVPFSEFSEPCETALFATNILESDLDDEELPVHLLVYKSLLKLPIDARAMCMSRIVFVGGATQIPGLKPRIMQELLFLIETRGWDPVYGESAKRFKNVLKSRNIQTCQRGVTEVAQLDETVSSMKIITSSIPQEVDPITEKLNRESRKGQHPILTGNLRVVNSLGAWAGGSLLSQMKIQAVSVIEREQWTQHGAAKISRLHEPSHNSQRQSMGPGALRSSTGERSSWTLGIWGL